MPHVPDLAAMNALEDEEIRIYALIGAVIVLSSSLEAMFFDIFQKAVPIPNASDIFYAVDSATAHLKMADFAMQGKLSGSDSDEWTRLYSRIFEATKKAAQRNLVAHGEMSKGVTLHPPAGYFAVSAPGMTVPPYKGALPKSSKDRTTEYHFSIKRDQPQLTRVSKKGADANAASLFKEAKSLSTLLEDVPCS